MHIPICVNEILEFLNIQPGQIGLGRYAGVRGTQSKDAGKTARAGTFICHGCRPNRVGKDPIQIGGSRLWADILTIRRMNFAQLDEVAPGVQFDFVLADLGVSSMQIDNPERGFLH